MAYQSILNPMPITGTVAVTGTFYQATQPVSGTVTVGNASLAVTGAFYQATQPVSLASTTITGSVAVTAASLPLPAGAATAAKQPAIGIAGTASADVITVQGIASGTPQPVSGTVGVSNFPASQAVTGSFYQTTQPVSLAALPALATGANVVGGVTQSGTWNIGTVTTLPALVAGAAIIGKVGIDQTTPGTTNAVSVTNASLAVTGPLTDTLLRATPVPFINNDLSGSGSLTARDLVVAAPAGAGATVTGTPTAGSAYFLACANGYGSANVTVLGTWTGTLYFEASENSTNGSDGDWINLNFRQTGIVNTVLGGNTATNGLFRGNVSAYTYFRVRSAGAGHTGTASIVVRYSSAVGAIFLNASIPAGTNVIGAANAVVGSNLTTGDTGAKTTTGVGATQTNANNKGAQIVLAMGAVSGTTPTFILKVQGSVDGGTTWYDLPGAATAALTATGNFGITVYSGVAVTAGTTTTGTTAQASSVLPRTWRVAWTVTGTLPSFTITSIQYNYLAT